MLDKASSFLYFLLVIYCTGTKITENEKDFLLFSNMMILIFGPNARLQIRNEKAHLNLWDS